MTRKNTNFFVKDYNLIQDIFPDKKLNHDKYLINCDVAENNISSSEVVEKLNLINNEFPLKINHLQFRDPRGNIEFRKQLVSFFNKHFNLNYITFESIYVTTSTSSAIELFSFLLSNNSKDGVIIPCPHYSGYERCLNSRGIVNIINVPFNLDESTSLFKIELTKLDDAFNQAKLKGIDCRWILLNNPHNPTGGVIHENNLIDLIKWSQTKSPPIHIVCDEIYACSNYNQKHTSIINFAKKLDAMEYIHVIWGFSKDFCASGLRVGVLISNNSKLKYVMKHLGYMTSPSLQTQHTLTHLLRDSVWTENFICNNTLRLRDACKKVCKMLDTHSIKYIKPLAGLSILIDFSEFLHENSWEGENKFSEHIMTKCNVLLTCGQECNCLKPGWFRCCFTSCFVTNENGDTELGAIAGLERIIKLVK